MKKLLFLCLCSMALGAHAQEDPVAKYAATITQADLKKHLLIIASDEFEGRDTGSEGQKKAAEYLVNNFKALGLTGPVKGNAASPYYQPVPLERKRTGESYLKPKKVEMALYNDFLVVGELAQPASKLTLVFGGYGLQTDAYNDYANLDVKGKGVVILMGEPKNAQGQLVAKAAPAQLTPQAKAAYAYGKGAALVVVVSDNEQMYERFAGRARSGGAMGLAAAKKGNSGYVLVAPRRAGELFGAANQAAYQDLVAKIGQTGQSTAGQLSAKVKLKITPQPETIASDNVLAFIEGTDKKEEVLVVSAHYDHVGKNAQGQVMNGADDDGSGTVALLEIAEAFAKAKAEGKGPRRSILFLAVTAEERGLLGSLYYSENPIFPLANTVADLNMDMIGRADDAHKDQPNFIYIIGSTMLSSDLHQASEEAAKKYVPDLLLDYKYNTKDDPNRFYYRSDHYNFAKHNIPSIFYFNGVHADYHQPSDDVDKINFEAYEKRTRLIFATAWEIANRDKRLVVDKLDK
jgi:Zn-dependent M28 family amino/carboxypeptidase